MLKYVCVQSSALCLALQNINLISQTRSVYLYFINRIYSNIRLRVEGRVVASITLIVLSLSSSTELKNRPQVMVKHIQWPA